MMTTGNLKGVLATAILLGLGGLLFFTRASWLPWFNPEPEGPAPQKDAHPHATVEKVQLSPQARANLGLVTRPIKLDRYWRTIQVPGVIVENHAKGDRAFVAPAAGVVQSIKAYPGDTVQPGQELVVLRLTSEHLLATQTELYKTAQEIQITEEEVSRYLALKDLVAGVKVIELNYQLKRLQAARRASRADLTAKGISPSRMDEVERGEFVREMVVAVPDKKEGLFPSASREKAHFLIEVEEIKAFPGEQVQAGQLLGTLAHHQDLYIEGRGFREETELLERATAENWAITAAFSEERASSWPAFDHPLTILYLANNLDPTSQTFPFYIPLPNQYREYNNAGKNFRIWRFRPGQRVELGVPVQEFRGVFLLPVGAVAREGVEAYVFRRSGDFFERKPVHAMFEDARNVVIADDGSIFAGNHIAHNAAEALNRALKAQNEEGGKGHDHHHH